MGALNILLPYNFTPHDRKALDFVVRTFVPSGEYEITLFNVYTPLPNIDTHRETIMKKMEATLRHQATQMKEQESALEDARQHLLDSGFPERRVRRVFRPRQRDIASDIIGMASEITAGIVVLNRKPGRIARFFTGSVFSRVVTALKDTTVCIVS